VRLRQEIRHLQQNLGVTTIMVTHDQEEALAVADRIVVLNQGCVEQVGTPLAVYRAPASPFVAGFVGKVNTLNGQVRQGQLTLGEIRLACGGPDRAVQVYLRPEDVLARPIAAGDAHVFEAHIERIDFLGAYCHVQVYAAALHGQPLTVSLSLNFLSERGLQAGSVLPLKLLPARIQVF